MNQSSRNQFGTCRSSHLEHVAAPHAAGLGSTVAVTLATLLMFAPGCADSRITLSDLDRLETETAQVEPVALDTSTLALTEMRPYTVSPGDVLNVTLTGLAGQYSQIMLHLRVHDDDAVMLPMVGQVTVTGLDLKGAEKAIYDAHVPTYVKDMSVFVELGESEVTTVVVVGAAGESGLVRLPRNERNLVYALSRAAGFSSMGSGRVCIQPARPERPELTYNLTNINDLRRALLAPPLESGDLIVVEPAEMNAIFVTGLVNAPAPIPLPQHGNLSLVRTLAAAGGLRDFLDPEEATLWRKLPGGQQVRAKIDLADVLAGKAPDIALRPGDVLDIPHTAKTRVREWVAANIRIGPFGLTAVYDPAADYRARLLRSNGGDDNLMRAAFFQGISAGFTNTLVPPP